MAKQLEKKTSAGDSLAALDKLSASDADDLERNFDLLGKRDLRNQNFRLRIVSFLSRVVL